MTQRINLGSPLGVIGHVDSDLFGSVAISQTGFHRYLEDTEYLNTTFHRFPGGGIAEYGRVVNNWIAIQPANIRPQDLTTDRSGFAYDLRHPELIAPSILAHDRRDGDQDQASFSQMVNIARETGEEVAVILPIFRYTVGRDFTAPAQRAEAMRTAMDDLNVFLGRVERGNFGNASALPPIILELGNELYDRPIEYAFIARAFIDTIDAFEDRTGIDVSIALQMGRGGLTFNTRLREGYFDPFFNADGVSVIPELRSLGPFDPSSMTFRDRVLAIDEMMMAILGDRVTSIDMLRHHELQSQIHLYDLPNSEIAQRDTILDAWRDAITRFGGDGEEVDYYLSAWSSATGGDQPFGMAAAAHTLRLFASMIERGVDRAAVWGITGAINQEQPRISEATMSLVDVEGFSASAEVLRLLATSARDSYLLDLPLRQIVDSDDDYAIYAFEDAERVTMFLTNSDVTGVERLTIDISTLGFFSRAEIVNVGTIGRVTNGFAEVQSRTITNLTGGAVTVTLDQDDEVVQILLYRNRATDRSDALSGTGNGDVIRALGGDDTVLGLSGGDRVHGGTGHDILRGAGGDDSLIGGLGNDWLLGDDGEDWLSGGAGNDTLSGGAGEDMVSGGAGADRVYGNDGDDSLNGGSNADSLVGGSGQDILLGELGHDRLDGQDGNDTLQGGEGDDTLYGGGGNDLLNGGLGADHMLGGLGNDTFVVNNASDRVTELAQGGTDRVLTLTSFRLSTQSEVESLRMADPGLRNAADLTGNAQSQEIIGNAGRNRIDGGGGQDTLTGGAGADTFVFSSAPALGDAATITDFNPRRDTIELDASVFGSHLLGVLGKDRFVSSNIGVAQDRTDRVIYDRDSGGLFFDPDGTGSLAAQRFATLDANLNLTSADFVLV